MQSFTRVVSLNEEVDMTVTVYPLDLYSKVEVNVIGSDLYGSFLYHGSTSKIFERLSGRLYKEKNEWMIIFARNIVNGEKKTLPLVHAITDVNSVNNVEPTEPAGYFGSVASKLHSWYSMS